MQAKTENVNRETERQKMKTILNGLMLALFSAVLAVFVDPLYAALKAAMAKVTRINRAPIARHIKFSQHAFVKRGHGKVLFGGRSPRWGFAVAGACVGLVLVAILVVPTAASAGATLAIATGATRDLKTILSELSTLQTEYKGKPMPEDVGQKFNALAQEAKAIQDEADREKQIKSFEKFSREIPDPTLPTGEPEAKGNARGGENEIVGYISVGEAFVNSPEFKQLEKHGFPQGLITPVQFEGVSIGGGIRGQKAGFIPITRKMIESKAVPTVNTGVIASMRDPEVVRIYTAEQDIMSMRNLVNVSPTNSPSIEYVTIDSFTRAATTVAESAAKPEATMAMSIATAPVRTLAVHMPVTEQQLQDVPQIQNMIDVELTYDVKRLEDEQIVWGGGTGQDLLGIMNTTGVAAGRTVGGDTLLDKIKRAATDVLVVGRSQPDAVGIHPYDWESVVLLKGTDNHYIWVVVTDAQGSRIWGLRVVETIAMEDSLSAVTTPQRVVLVGAYRRGATLWDRQQVNTQVGWINDQFTKNLRTIRVEERVAFGVKRPKAFRYIETVAEVL